MKNKRDYRDLYIQSNNFLLADVFEKFLNMYHKIFELDPACFFTDPGLLWNRFKKTKV